MSENSKITKYQFLETIKCDTLGWYSKNKPKNEYDEILEYNLQVGNEIEILARRQFTDGILVNEINNFQAQKITNQLIKDVETSTIFQATFQNRDYITKVDVLERNKENNTWNLIEVKSGLNQTESKIQDLAYTTMVVESTGLAIEKVELMMISKDFVYGMSENKLFDRNNVTSEVKTVIAQFKEKEPDYRMKLYSNTIPQPTLKLACKDCIYQSDCFNSLPEYNILILPRLSQQKIDELVNQNILDINRIPDNFNLTNNQFKYVKSVKKGELFIDKQILYDLQRLSEPLYYLDFETFNPYLPLYENTIPYEQVPFQYSLHIKNGIQLNHKEFLADENQDPRPNFIISLIQDLGDTGSIFVYSHYESTIIKKLMKYMPDRELELKNILNRLVDLEKLIEKFVNHPNFYGSNSIKKVLPAIVTDLSYDNLEIQNGQKASILFEKLVIGDLDRQEIDKIRNSLLEYCKMDTLAMVKLYEKLIEELKL